MTLISTWSLNLSLKKCAVPLQLLKTTNTLLNVSKSRSSGTWICWLVMSLGRLCSKMAQQSTLLTLGTQPFMPLCLDTLHWWSILSRCIIRLILSNVYRFLRMANKTHSTLFWVMSFQMEVRLGCRLLWMICHISSQETQTSKALCAQSRTWSTAQSMNLLKLLSKL